MKKFCAIILLLLLTGCSTKFAYRNADWLVYWYIDDFISLTQEQEDKLDSYLAQWLEWHKKTQLPNYLKHLDEIKSDIVQNKITPSTIELHNEKVIQHWVTIRNKVTPDLVSLVPLVSEQQIEQIFTELDDQAAEKKAKSNKLTEAKRRQKWIKRTEKSLKKWLGSVSDSQQKMITSLYQSQSNTSELWMEYRSNYQTDLKSALLLKTSSDKSLPSIETLFLNPEVYRSKALNTQNNLNRQAYYSFLYGIYLSLSEKQRLHLIEEIDALSSDILELSQ